MGGAFGFAPTSHLSIWTEGDADLQTKAAGGHSWVVVNETSVEVYRGIWLKFSPQLRTSGGAPGFSDLRRLAFAVDLLPRTHWNLNVSYYHDHTFDASTSALLASGIKELLARIRAHLRRAAKQVVELESFNFGDVEVNFKKYAARKGGQALDLSAREFEILRYLIRRRGEIVTRDQLLDEVWGYDSTPVTRTVDNHIARLRQKIEQDPSEPQHIITVHRLGYRFVE